jgi:hypothetical protein
MGCERSGPEKIFHASLSPRAEPMGAHRYSEVFNSSISLVVRRHDLEGTTGSAFQQEIVAIPAAGSACAAKTSLAPAYPISKRPRLERGGGEAGVRLLP